MKHFIKTNWYKMMIGTSCLMASFSFLINTISPARATVNNTNSSEYRTVPLNSDGTLTVKLSDEQLKMIIPPPIQSINIEQVRGKSAAYEIIHSGFLGSNNALSVSSK